MVWFKFVICYKWFNVLFVNDIKLCNLWFIFKILLVSVLFVRCVCCDWIVIFWLFKLYFFLGIFFVCIVLVIK